MLHGEVPLNKGASVWPAAPELSFYFDWTNHSEMSLCRDVISSKKIAVKTADILICSSQIVSSEERTSL